MIAGKDLLEDAQGFERCAAQAQADCHRATAQAAYARHLAAHLPDAAAVAELKRIVGEWLDDAGEQETANLCAKLGVTARGKKRRAALEARLWGKDGEAPG